MLSIAELLNPLEPNSNNADHPQPSPRPQRHGLPNSNSIRRHSEERPSLAVKRRGRLSPAAQSPINFPPFEDVNDEAVREIRKYRIPQFGHIHRSCEHIPYNSSKRDFSTKTGRGFIEAFKYTFQIPGQTPVYTVMWDYTIGLVRLTPFFKCMGYTKTKPSQALDKNPGLRDVCPSITGGAVLAQGYWMPFYCAKALCATFCHDISGALIPIFGPDFPLHCTLPGSPRFGDMMISQQLIAKSAVPRASRPNRRPETEVESSDIVFPNPLRREAAAPRPASMPTPAPLILASHGTERLHFDAKPTRKRLRDTRDANHKISHNPMTTLSGLYTSDGAGDLQPDCEDCEGRCFDPSHANFHNSKGHKPSLDPHRTTDNKFKRLKLADESPPLIGGMREHKERSTRRALPQSRGPLELKRRETEEIAQEEDDSEYPAASTLRQIENKAKEGAHSSRVPSPTNISSSRRRSV